MECDSPASWKIVRLLFFEKADRVCGKGFSWLQGHRPLVGDGEVVRVRGRPVAEPHERTEGVE